MDEGEYRKKYTNLRILKSIQEYLKDDSKAPTAIYPINVPDDLLYQILQNQGPEKADETIHTIFKIGLRIWSEQLYREAFGSEENLRAFIEIMKRRNKE